MEKEKRTYGVYNVTEWLAQLRVGKGQICVHFTGGAMTTQGVTPATYVTSDLAEQLLIERSDAFLSGKVKLVSSHKTGERLQTMRNPVGVSACGRAAETTSPCDKPADARGICGRAAETTSPCDKPADLAAAQSAAEEAEGANEPAAGEPSGDATGDASDSVDLEFSCNDDARDYLELHYGVKRSQIRTREQIVSAGREVGLEIHFE